MINDIDLVLTFAIALTFLLPVGFGINLATAYPMNNNSNNWTSTNTTNSTIVANVTAGDTITIPVKPDDTSTDFFDKFGPKEQKLVVSNDNISMCITGEMFGNE